MSINWQTYLPLYTNQSPLPYYDHITQPVYIRPKTIYHTFQQQRFSSVNNFNNYNGQNNQLSSDHSRIQTRITQTQRQFNNHHKMKNNKNNLKYIQTNDSGFKVAVFNAHSVQRRHRRSEIIEFIRDENIDILFITETWLKQHGDENKLKHLTPSGYKIKSVPRGSLGGGILAIFREHIPITITESFPFNHRSYEVLQLTITSPQHIHLFCLYKTPPRKKNGLRNSDFVTELPFLLDHINYLCGKSIILGDFNVQYNKKENYLTKSILDITTSYDLKQGINEPTFYRSNNILDWILYRENDNIVTKCEVNHLLMSDHSAVVCFLNLQQYHRKPKYKITRDMKNINIENFKKDVGRLVDRLGTTVSAETLDNGLRNILDEHAPAVERKIPERCDPWYPDVATELQKAKRERRRAERKRKKTGLTVDLNILKNKNFEVVSIVQRARDNYLKKTNS